MLFYNHAQNIWRFAFKRALIFLNENETEVDYETELVILIVANLYTSILHEYVLKALGYFLKHFKEDKHSQCAIQIILDVACFIFNKSSLTFY